MKLVKTETPENYPNCKITSHASGNCPYSLIQMSEADVTANSLEADVVEDTAAFFSAYDLSEGEEESGMV